MARPRVSAWLLGLAVTSVLGEDTTAAPEQLPAPLPLASPERSGLDHHQFNVGIRVFVYSYVSNVTNPPPLDGGQLPKAAVLHPASPRARSGGHGRPRPGQPPAAAQVAPGPSLVSHHTTSLLFLYSESGGWQQRTELTSDNFYDYYDYLDTSEGEEGEDGGQQQQGDSEGGATSHGHRTRWWPAQGHQRRQQRPRPGYAKERPGYAQERPGSGPGYAKERTSFSSGSWVRPHSHHRRRNRNKPVTGKSKRPRPAQVISAAHKYFCHAS